MDDNEYPDGVWVMIWNGIKWAAVCLLIVAIVAADFHYTK